MKIALSLIIPLLFSGELYSRLLINEIACGTSSDWVELFLAGDSDEKIDISPLFVTMYYGTNEQLGTDPISIYSYDRAETPYDDRFIVIHLTEPDRADETDITGDTNRNGRIDVYCNNYYNSLWNTDGVVAIDTDDDPANGGIIDFVFYSSRDGSPNTTIESYVAQAQLYNEWTAFDSDNIQDCAVFIGGSGLSSYMSLARKNTADTNAPEDFIRTYYQTPGRGNLFPPTILQRRIFRALKKKISIIPTHPVLCRGEIPLFIHLNCNIRYRVFSSIGVKVYESPLYRSIPPGFFSLYWNPTVSKRGITTGLYICKIEAVNTAYGLAEEKIVYLILSYYQ